ncbi:ribonuclease domain-containing protein [Promicromonospora sp. NPDC023805]|uniref:ribonuclease domain-containing protein n=1 Tax=Promicromonospora sp. NPDC023805 TaxID=3154696 RepID=UPI0033C95495
MSENHSTASIQKHSAVSTMLRMLVVLTAMVGFVAGGVTVAQPADASVFNSCTHSGCAEAYSSNSIWSSKGYPSTRGWVSWPNGQCNFAGGVHRNSEGQLPAGHSYLEFDVTPRACNAARQSYRLILDRTNGDLYFSPNHYGDFYKM